MSRKSTVFSPSSLLTELQHYPDSTVFWVAYSGGSDSTALLHAMATLQTNHALHVKAVHINHGLHPQADAWQSHCEATFANGGVPVDLLEASVGTPAQR